MRFATASLSVCKDCAIIPLDNVFHKLKGSLLVDNALLRTLVENRVECKRLHVILFIRFAYADLVARFVGLDDAQTSPILFFLVHGAYSHHHLDGFAHRRFLRIIENKLCYVKYRVRSARVAFKNLIHEDFN